MRHGTASGCGVLPSGMALSSWSNLNGESKSAHTARTRLLPLTLFSQRSRQLDIHARLCRSRSFARLLRPKALPARQAPISASEHQGAPWRLFVLRQPSSGSSWPKARYLSAKYLRDLSVNVRLLLSAVHRNEPESNGDSRRIWGWNCSRLGSSSCHAICTPCPAPGFASINAWFSTLPRFPQISSYTNLCGQHYYTWF